MSSFDWRSQVKDVKDLILSAHNSSLRAASDKKFLFDIVANGINGIDVDKCAQLSSNQNSGPAHHTCSCQSLAQAIGSCCRAPAPARSLPSGKQQVNTTTGICLSCNMTSWTAGSTTWRGTRSTAVSRPPATLTASCASPRCLSYTDMLC